MRGLTSAAVDQSAEGEKARTWLVKWGVDVQGLRDGTQSTYDTLMKMSEGINSLAPGVQRTEALRDVLKKIGIDLGAGRVEMKKNAAYFDEHGLPVWTDAEQKRGADYLKWATGVEEKWNNIWLNIKNAIAAGAEFIDKGLAAAIAQTPARHPDNASAAAAVKAGQTPGIWPDPSIAVKNEAAAAARAIQQARIAADEKTFGMTEEGLKFLASEAETKAKQAFEKYRADKSSTTISAEDIMKDRAAWEALEKSAAGYKAQLDAINAAKKEPLRVTPGLDLVTEGIGPVRFPYAAPGEIGRVPTLSGSGSRFQLGQAYDQALQEFDSEVAKLARAGAGSEERGGVGSLGRSYGLDDWKQQEEIAKAVLGYQEEMIKLQAGPGGELETARKIYGLRMAAAEDGKDQAILSLDYLKEEAKIRKSESDKQHEELQRTSAGLFSTLFNKPSDFGRQLGSTLREAVMKPITEGLGSMTARALQPLVYGADGQGGIAGMFKSLFGGGRQTEVTANTGALTLNTRALMAMVAAIGLGMPSAGVAAFGASFDGAAAPSLSYSGSSPLSRKSRRSLSRFRLSYSSSCS
jgi:hypothetical protein